MDIFEEIKQELKNKTVEIELFGKTLNFIEIKIAQEVVEEIKNKYRETKRFTKLQLLQNDVVELRSGCFLIVNKKNLIGNKDTISLEDYNNELEHKFTKINDIVKIYTIKEDKVLCFANLFSKENLKLVWSRERNLTEQELIGIAEEKYKETIRMIKPNKYIIETKFWTIGHETDTDLIELEVPSNVTKEEVYRVLKRTHKTLLDLEQTNTERGYSLGYNYVTLLEAVCEENRTWKYDKVLPTVKFDATQELEE